MEEEKESDIRFPLVFTVFLLCVTTGGILLFIYVFFSHLSQPWYPATALVLIGMPWIFWFLTYTYSFAKRCFIQDAGGPHQVSRRQTTRIASTAAAATQKEPETNSA